MNKHDKLTLETIMWLSQNSPGGVRISGYMGLVQATIYPNGVNSIEHHHFEADNLCGAVMQAKAFMVKKADAVS
jgi:hypothetical protein